MNPQPSYPYSQPGYTQPQMQMPAYPQLQPQQQGGAWKAGISFALVLVPVVLFTAWGVLMEVRINKLTESQVNREQLDQLRGQMQGLEGKLAEAGTKLNAAATGLDRAAGALESLARAAELKPEPLKPDPPKDPKAGDPKAGDPKRESPPR